MERGCSVEMYSVGRETPWGGGSWALRRRVSRNWVLPAPLKVCQRVSWSFDIAIEPFAGYLSDIAYTDAATKSCIQRRIEGSDYTAWSCSFFAALTQGHIVFASQSTFLRCHYIFILKSQLPVQYCNHMVSKSPNIEQGQLCPFRYLQSI